MGAKINDPIRPRGLNPLSPSIRNALRQLRSYRDTLVEFIERAPGKLGRFSHMTAETVVRIDFLDMIHFLDQLDQMRMGSVHFRMRTPSGGGNRQQGRHYQSRRRNQ